VPFVCSFTIAGLCDMTLTSVGYSCQRPLRLPNIAVFKWLKIFLIKKKTVISICHYAG
jgi:hypothetical protein